MLLELSPPTDSHWHRSLTANPPAGHALVHTIPPLVLLTIDPLLIVVVLKFRP